MRRLSALHLSSNGKADPKARSIERHLGPRQHHGEAAFLVLLLQDVGARRRTGHRTWRCGPNRCWMKRDWVATSLVALAFRSTTAVFGEAAKSERRRALRC